MVGCFFRDLGVNIMRNIMVRCVENIVNIYVFLKLQIFDFFDILGSSGRPGTSFWWLFGCLGQHFSGLGGCWECTGNILQCLLVGARLAKVPRILRASKSDGKSSGSGPRTSSTTDCWTESTGLKDCRN